MRSEHGSLARTTALLSLLTLIRADDPQCLAPRERFCEAYAPRHLLADDGCLAHDADAAARLAAEAFSRLVRRYDCDTPASVAWTCRDCEEAYGAWACAVQVGAVRPAGGGEALRPCRHLCRLVEQRCPYFHPSVRDQYAGERVFKCIDPDIPDLDSMQNATTYGPPHRCYCPPSVAAADPECGPRRPAGPRHRGAHRSGGAPGRPPMAMPVMMMLIAIALAS